MQILMTGVGDAFSRVHFGTSALIRSEAGYLQIDCPEPYHRILHEAACAAGWEIDARDVNDVIITHLHGDHCAGLEMFGYWRWFLRTQDPSFDKPRLHTTQPTASRLWERFAPSMDARHTDQPRALEDFFEVRLMEPETTTTIAGLTVECRFTGHSIPTIGLRLHDDRHTLGWSGDTPFEPAHIDWLADANLIVHECNLGPAHTPIADLNALPSEIRHKMRLVHLPDDFEPDMTDIPQLTEGDVITLEA